MDPDKKRSIQTEFNSVELHLMNTLSSDLIIYPSFAAAITGLPSFYYLRFRMPYKQLNVFLIYGLPLAIGASCAALVGVQVLNNFISNVGKLPKSSKLSKSLDRIIIERDMLSNIKQTDTDPNTVVMKPPSNKI